ncbi:MAG: aldolase/citrate lyase family protein [bacterium]|nr:aldolase/citrate lyase family protein [bacterium]
MDCTVDALINNLKELKDLYSATGIKVEFEDEGATSEDLIILKKISDEAGLNLSVKVGGCGALRDVREAFYAGANAIVAPMIESPYAVKKYINTIKSVYENFENGETKFYINIETKNGLEYLDEILNCEDAKYIYGIVLGRTDLSESLELNNSTDSSIIENIADKTALLVKKYHKEFIIGGGISPLSVQMFNKLKLIDKYETRKIIFNAKNPLIHINAQEGILKALRFELMWIKNKESRNILTKNDVERIKVLEARCSVLSL